jgi:hypothetical protein
LILAFAKGKHLGFLANGLIRVERLVLSERLLNSRKEKAKVKICLLA